MAESNRDTVRDHQTADRPSSNNAAPAPGRVWVFRGLGLVLAALVYLALGSADIPPDARTVAGIGTLMAVWWMTEAIPLAATALLPMVLVPLFTDGVVLDATTPYADPIVFLFLGGFLIAIAMQKWNLHRRIALLTIRQVGTHPRQIILGMMISTAFLSMWVSNTATTLMMLPIAMSVLTLVVERSHQGGTDKAGAEAAKDLEEQVDRGEAISDIVEDRDVRIFGVALVLAIAWSASIGGLGTLLGSPPNAIVAGYISSELDKEVGFLQWMLLGVPTLVVFLGIAWLLITRLLFRFKLDEVPGGKEMINEQLDSLGPMTQGEKMVLAVFGGAAFLWIVPGLLSLDPPVLIGEAVPRNCFGVGARRSGCGRGVPAGLPASPGSLCRGWVGRSADQVRSGMARMRRMAQS